MTSLPPDVADALAQSAPGTRVTMEGAGVPFSALTWGEAGDRPLLLVHGVTASAEIWWRAGPALAATRRRVVAVDLPGHGHTGHWTGRSRFRETAADLAEAIRGAGLDDPSLQVIAHSWGSMVATCLPSVGIRPTTLVLLDPPTITRDEIIREIAEAQGLATPGFDPVAAMRALHPDWTDRRHRRGGERPQAGRPERGGRPAARERRLGFRARGAGRPGCGRHRRLGRPRRAGIW